MSSLNKFLKLIPKTSENNETYTISSYILDKVTTMLDVQNQYEKHLKIYIKFD